MARQTGRALATLALHGRLYVQRLVLAAHCRHCLVDFCVKYRITYEIEGSCGPDGLPVEAEILIENWKATTQHLHKLIKSNKQNIRISYPFQTLRRKTGPRVY